MRGAPRAARQVHIGAPDPHLTGAAGTVADTELAGWLHVAESIDTTVGPIKQRSRGFSAVGDR
ncbi:MAG: hypothetical protein ABI382_02185 [Nakamurella sp.]